MDVDSEGSSKYSQNESNDDESQDDSQNNNEDDVEYQNGDENEYSAKDLEEEADDENDEEEVLLAKGDEFGQIPLDPIAPVIVDNQNSIPEPFIAPQFRVPCMRGFLDWKGPKITCKGRWGMSREAFDGSDATSDFEITLQTDFPARFDIHAASPSQLSGIYSGSFCIQQPGKKVALRIDEKKIVLTYRINSSSSSSSYNISGEGQNKFGKFTIQGIFSLEDLSVELYRYYVPKQIRAKNSNSSAIASAASAAIRNSKKAAAVAALALNPNRPKRMNDDIKKCLDILKFIQKQPQAYWFLEPVDAVKLQISDYHDIVKQPMDFSLIEANVNAHLYESSDEFANHVRLVFRNAISYNTKRDSAVNIAARELNTVFEDRYRYVMTSAHLFDSRKAPLDGNSKSIDEEGMKEEDRQHGSAIKKSVSSNMASSNNNSSSNNRRRGGGGGGSKIKSPKLSLPKTVYIMAPPSSSHAGPLVDSSTSAFMEMQHKLSSLETELTRLRRKDKERDARDKMIDKFGVATTKDILSFEEKSDLVDMISRLPGDKQALVYDTILKTGGNFFDNIDSNTTNEEGEFNFPIDSLDNNTLRYLHNFCKTNLQESDGDDDDDDDGRRKRKRTKRKQSNNVKSPNPIVTPNIMAANINNATNLYASSMYQPAIAGSLMYNASPLANNNMGRPGMNASIGMMDMTNLMKRPRLDGPNTGNMVGFGMQQTSSALMTSMINNTSGNMLLQPNNNKLAPMNIAPFSMMQLPPRPVGVNSMPMISSGNGSPIINPSANSNAAASSLLMMMNIAKTAPTVSSTGQGVSVMPQSKFIQF